MRKTVVVLKMRLFGIHSDLCAQRHDVRAHTVNQLTLVVRTPMKQAQVTWSECRGEVELKMSVCVACVVAMTSVQIHRMKDHCPSSGMSAGVVAVFAMQGCRNVFAVFGLVSEITAVA